MRASFVEHMIQAGWKIRTCDTDADVAIAQDCQPGDIVISGDSDMSVYPSVSILWRPISRNLILVYNISDLCQATTVKACLEDFKVVLKNTVNKTFESSHRVFVDLQQTPNKDSRVQLQPSVGKDQIIRLRSPQSFIRYRTAEPPAMLKIESRLLQPPSPQPLRPDPNPQDDPMTSLPSQVSGGHPVLPRTRTPRNRHRYSFKTRRGATNPPPPDKMKRYKFKPHKERMDTAADSTEDDKTESKVKVKSPRETLNQRLAGS
ncbi:hypothetical protein BGZ80_007511 [Entomortierella chlamydospora]|uniref:Uncharacterized protein n=1 Tax=Entomortierella chlamydospora TaxID=101097 RepID=A0A9P6MED5_9FUNG|nr:hypothetical protein BGZ80_007511 [Entomortierella chlamydospora]